MRLFKLTIALLFFFSLTFQSCQKELSPQKSNVLNETQLLKIHQSNIETWIKLLPIDGQIKNSTNILTKTINQNGQLVTRMQIGDKGSSLLFISGNRLFNVYGLNSKNLNANHSGVVEIFDFQSLQKKGVRFVNGKLYAFVNYPNEDVGFNAYLNKFNIDQFRRNKNASTTTPTANGPNLLSVIRKFLCELFGGYWAGTVAENGGPNGTCFTSSNGEEVVQNLPPPEPVGGGVNTNWGLLYPNINNVNFFDFSSQMWDNITAGLNAGSNVNNWTITAPVSFIDQECADPDRIRALFIALNTKYYTQPATLEFGTLDQTFEEFKIYKNDQQVFIPIIPWLIKAGANGAADALMQALFIYLTEDNCPSYGAAFGHDKFSKTQVARSTLEGLIPWHTPGGKLGKAAFTAIGDVMANLIDGKYGESNYPEMGTDFMLGFFSDLAGGAAGELASKYALPSIAKGLLNKFSIHYKTVTSWLGGGLQQISKSFVHNGQTITASRVMKGFAENKVAVIGRNMAGRVKPFANNLSNEMGTPVLTWPGFNNALSDAQNLANNLAWIKSLKDQGYSFYDVGLDPNFTAQGNFDEGPFYSMELNEIFR